MNRKATVKIAGEFITWLVFLLMVISIFLGTANKIKDNRLHQMRVEAIDYSLVRAAVLSSPNKVDYKYAQNSAIEMSVAENPCIIEAKIKEKNNVLHRIPCFNDQFTQLNQQQLETSLRITN